jgi:hypothetical protein
VTLERDPTERHRRKGAPSPATQARLDRWHATLRAELDDVIRELRPPPPADGMPWAKGVRPDLTTRLRLVDLGVRIAHELGTEVDASSRANGASPPAKPRPRSRVAF